MAEPLRAPGRPRSDIDGLTKGGAPDRLPKPGLRDDIDRAPEETLQLQLQAGEIQQGATRLQDHQEVDIAALPLFAARHGPEDAHVVRATLGSKTVNRVPKGG
jgi:hypothetical protein